VILYNVSSTMHCTSCSHNCCIQRRQTLLTGLVVSPDLNPENCCRTPNFGCP